MEKHTNSYEKPSLHTHHYTILYQQFAQQKLVKDIDFDGIKDTVYIDTEKVVVVCKLSTQNFRIIESKPIEINEQAGILESENGFQFVHPVMASGFSAQFRYDKNKKYSSGNGVQDGSGASSVNLLTNRYLWMSVSRYFI